MFGRQKKLPDWKGQKWSLSYLRVASRLIPSRGWGSNNKRPLQAEKRPVKIFYHRFSWCSPTDMASKLWLALSLWLLLSTCEGGKQMSKLSAKKLCADADCSHPILIARALQDYYPADCRFIPFRQGQLIYVYAMLKGRGNLFWAGTVQDSYYGQQEARIGHFPSSVVEEVHPLMPADTEVKTTNWDFYCN